MAFTMTTTGSAAYTATEGDSLSGMREIVGIYWTADAASEIATDNDFLVSDAAGNRIIGKRAKAAGDDLAITYDSNPLIVDGVVITTMDAGVAYIHFKVTR